MKNKAYPLTSKEEYLNDLYSDTYNLEQILFEFDYLTNKNRGKATTKNQIIKSYNNRKFGTLLKRFDPIRYNCEN